MKRKISLLTALLLIIAMFSCTLKDSSTNGDTPVDPEVINLTVTSPKSGDTLYTSSSFEVKWTSNTTQRLIIDYTLDNGKSWSQVASNIENTGSYVWSPIPNTTTTEGRIRMLTADSAITSTSAGLFIVERGTTTNNSLLILEPNGGEKWKGNSNQAIKWVSVNIDSVNIDYTIDNGSNWISVATNVPSTGFYSWYPLPNVPSSNAKIRILNAADNTVLDESDEVFSIEPEDLITVTLPNGGEEWLAGSSQYIKWDTKLDITSGSASLLDIDNDITNLSLKHKSISSSSSQKTIKTNPRKIETVENVKIEYSVNGGASWNTIIASTPNNGIYFWSSLPSANSAQCLIRVSDAVDGVPFDFNNSTFAIYSSLPQEINVISPNGNESWSAGSSQEIKWTSKDVSFVKIEYTTDNGVSWNQIIDSTPSDGFYIWEQLPSGAATNCRIKISDATDGTPSDLSDELFSISPEPSINLTSPNGGEILQSGSSINITWTSENIAKINLDYTINGGAEWISIAQNIESTGTYTWENIPDVNSSQVKVKISDADDGAPSDVSDNNLAISNQIVQSLEITAPNGGEFWEANTSKNITWNSSAVTHVKIEFTSNNGLEWTVVENNLPSSGSYDWTVPNVNSTQAKIRISDAVDGDPVDESNSTFRIKQAGTLKLLKPESGDNWVAGELNRIEWEADNVEKVKIEFTTSNAIYDPTAEYFDDEWFDLVTNAPGAAGFYETRFTIPSTEYRLRISDAEFDEPVDFSGLFTVKGQPSYTLELTSPNGGENWLIGEPYEITWTSENVENISLDYSLNNGTTWESIVANIPSTGLYNWVVPNTSSRSDLCKIRIKNAADSTIFDLSDSPFSIHPKDKLLRIVSPNGGENVLSGTPTRVEWTSAGIENVDLYFTIDNTNTWQEIIKGYKSTGAYMWTPPDTSSSLARIKIVDSDDATVMDESDSYFNIHNSNDGAIQIVSPNGGESILANSVATIRWVSSNVKDVKIEFSLNNGAEWQTISASTPSNGSYQWTSVPDIYSELCAIRISDVTRSDINSVSSSTFTISNKVVQTVEVSAPNGGETVTANSTYNITWYSNAIDSVKIEYTINNGNNWIEIASGVPNTGAYNWAVPSVNTTQAKIRVSDFTDGDPIDESNSMFSIEETKTLSITKPVKGDIWVVGKTDTIKWTTNVSQVTIEYETGEGIWNKLIDKLDASGGEYLTNIFTTPSENYRIRISEQDQGSPISYSDKFTVREESISVITPNGAESWLIGEPYEITWSSENVDKVNIDYSIDNGTTWNNIATNIVSNGIYNWVIPTIANMSDLCKVRISKATDNTTFDVSDTPFSIHPKDKLLRIVSPNGGENVIAGTPTRIEWTSSGIENVDIYFTIDNAVSWKEVVSGIKSTGAYQWTPPDTSSSLARVKVVDSGDATIQDESDSYFNIFKADDGTVTVLYPNGGEQLNAGGSADIKWLTENVKDVKIEYSSNNGAEWTTLVASTPTDPGYYSWNPVPTEQTSHGVIRISDASRSDINDLSDAVFTINNSSVVTQTITLVSPVGGEIWVAGETRPITWTSSNINNVTLEYSLDNGNSWQTIAENITNLETYQWTVPNEVSTSVLVRVKDAYDGSPSSKSTAPFTIKPLPTISLISPNGGEVLTEGSKKPITWTSQYVQNVRIEFSENNGGSWTELIASTPSDGSWTWDPVASTISDLCAIKISDADRNDIFDVSASTFSIEEKVDQIAGEPASIFLVSQSLESIGVTESGSPETAQIAFEVQDSSGTPIDIAHAVDVSFKFGAHPNGGELLAPTLVKTDENGQAIVNLTSGTIAGAVQVIAEIDNGGNTIRSKPVNIAIHGGLPDASHFSIGPAQVNYPYLHKLAAEGEITALVGDKYSNPVRPGTVVYFSTEAGVVEGSGLTNDNGTTTVKILSGDPQPNDPVDGPGFFYVTAQTIDENDAQITTKTEVLYSGYPIISNVAPLTFDVANGGSQTFTYTVADENGNPLAPGNTYKVKVETDGSAGLSGDVNIVMPDVQSGNLNFSFELYDSDPTEVKSANAIVTIEVSGPNGRSSYSVSGTIK